MNAIQSTQVVTDRTLHRLYDLGFRQARNGNLGNAVTSTIQAIR